MISRYCRFGINHHLLFPGVLEDSHAHEKTLTLLLKEELCDVIDLSLPSDGQVRKREAKMLLDSGKTVLYNFPLFSLKNPALDVNAADRTVRLRALDEAKKHLDYACEAGAARVTFASGPYRSDLSFEEQQNSFLEYSLLFDEELGKRGQTASLEPFDRSIGKNLLLGKAHECVSYIERLRALGANRIGLMQDMGHIPLIGESFAHSLERSKPYLFHIHLGNCVMKNPQSAYYGDLHPPLGIDSGENDMPELCAFVTALKEIGYLYEGGNRTVTLEAQPYPGVSSITSAKVGKEKFASALRAVFSL